ncbi:MAG: oligosaccharide flippase family protein [Fibrobacterota bacterium]
MADIPSRGTRLIRNSVLNLANSSITMVVTFVTSIVVARTLKPENYGIYNLVLWVTGIATWAIGMGLVHAVTKYVAEYRGRRDPVTVDAIISFILRVELILSLGATAVLVFFRLPIADYFFSPRETFFFLIAFVGLVPGILTAVFSGTIEGIQKFEYFTYFHLIVTPLAFLVKMLVLYLGYRIDGLLLVSLGFSFINTAFFCWILRREGLHFSLFKSPEPDVRRKIWKYNLSVGAISIADKVVWDKSENFFLGRFCTSAQIGYYNLAYNVAQRFMNVLPSTFWRVLFPAMSEYFGSKDHEKIKRLFYLSSRYIAFFSFPVGVAGIVLAFPMIQFFYGREYLGAKYALQIMFFCSIFSSLSKPGSAILYGTERQGFILKYGMVLAAVNIGLDLLVIRAYGALGAACCYGVVTIAGAMGGLIYTCRTVGLQYPFRSVTKIIFSSLIMGITMELIVRQKAELFGFIVAIPVGMITYFVCSAVLGSFEEEDYILMNSVKVALPGRWKRGVDSLTGFLSQFKSGGGKNG